MNLNFKYDTSVFKNSSIQTIEDICKIVSTNSLTVFIGPYGIGKSLAATKVVEHFEKDNNFYIKRIMKETTADQIRSILIDMGHIHCQDKEKLLIIDETNVSSTMSLDKLRGHVDGSADNVQIKVLLLTNNKPQSLALNNRTVFIKFHNISIMDMISHQNEILEKILNPEQLYSFKTLAQLKDNAGVQCSYRQFKIILNLIINNNFTIESAFAASLDDDVDKELCKTLNRDLFNNINNPKDIKALVENFKKLKSHQEINYFFNYGKAALANKNRVDFWKQLNIAHVEYLKIKSKILSENEFNMQKVSIILYALTIAKII